MKLLMIVAAGFVLLVGAYYRDALGAISAAWPMPNSAQTPDNHQPYLPASGAVGSLSTPDRSAQASARTFNPNTPITPVSPIRRAAPAHAA